MQTGCRRLIQPTRILLSMASLPTSSAPMTWLCRYTHAHTPSCTHTPLHTRAHSTTHASCDFRKYCQIWFLVPKKQLQVVQAMVRSNMQEQHMSAQTTAPMRSIRPSGALQVGHSTHSLLLQNHMHAHTGSYKYAYIGTYAHTSTCTYKIHTQTYKYSQAHIWRAYTNTHTHTYILTSTYLARIQKYIRTHTLTCT